MKNFDRSYFKDIDSEEKAYWLGFFYADGYVYKNGKQISICLSERDSEHLKKFADIFQAHLKPYSYVDKRTDNRYTTVRCVVSSKQICNDLYDKGIKNAKSLVGGGKIIDFVPEKLHHHFIRGFADGDGCISKSHVGEYSFTLIGTRPFLVSIRRVMTSGLNISKTKIQPRVKVYVLAWGGNFQLEVIRDWLYQDASIFLERKRDKFFSIVAGRSTKTSKHKNVHWCNTREKWIVRKMVKGKQIHLGSYDTEVEAATIIGKS